MLRMTKPYLPAFARGLAVGAAALPAGQRHCQRSRLNQPDAFAAQLLALLRFASRFAAAAYAG